MSQFDNFSDIELFNILNCNKRQELYENLDQDKADYLLDLAETLSKKRRRRNKLIQSISIPLTDASSYPLLLLWCLVGVISLGILPLLISTAVMALMSIVIGSFFTYSNYQEIKKMEDKTNQFFQFYLLKNQLADELLARQGLAIKVTRAPKYTNKHQLTLIKESLSTVMLISTSLFGTYILGLNAVLTVMQISAALGVTLGPIGLVLGLSLALAFSIYFGYKHYQVIQQADRIKFQQKCLATIVDKKTALCEALKNQEMSVSQENDEIQIPAGINPVNGKKSKSKFLFKLSKCQFFEQPKEREEEPRTLPLDIGFG